MNCSDFEYPIKLEGVNCLRSDFLTCESESTTVCCKELLKPDSAGPQEVHSLLYHHAYHKHIGRFVHGSNCSIV
jgi:hypothetical protein